MSVRWSWSWHHSKQECTENNEGPIYQHDLQIKTTKHYWKGSNSLAKHDIELPELILSGEWHLQRFVWYLVVSWITCLHPLYYQEMIIAAQCSCIGINSTFMLKSRLPSDSLEVFFMSIKCIINIRCPLINNKWILMHKLL